MNHRVTNKQQQRDERCDMSKKNWQYERAPDGEGAARKLCTLAHDDGRMIVAIRRYDNELRQWERLENGTRVIAWQDLPDCAPIERPKRKRPTAVVQALPDWLDADAWERYREHRKRLGIPMTAYSESLAIGKLGRLAELGHAPVAVIAQSIENGWRGLFKLNVDMAQSSARGMEAARVIGELTGNTRSNIGRDERGTDYIDGTARRMD